MALKRVLALGVFIVCSGVACNDESADTVVSTDPSPPNAVIAGSQDVKEGDAVSLDGSRSFDPDNDITSFAWEQISGAPVSLTGAAEAIATFTAPQVGGTTVLEFALTVTDRNGSTDTATTLVAVHDLNLPPDIILPAPIFMDALTTVTIDATTTDIDGSIASWAWTQVSGQPGTLVGETAEDVDLTAPDVDQQTELILRLTVADDEGKVSAADVSVFVRPVVTEIQFVDTSLEGSAQRNTIWRPLIVETRNASGIRVRGGPDSALGIMLSVQPGTGSAGGALHGTLTVGAVAGQARFTDLFYDDLTPAGNGLILEAASTTGGFTSVTTIRIDVTWPSAMPGGVTAGNDIWVHDVAVVDDGTGADLIAVGRFNGENVDFDMVGARLVSSNANDGFVARYDGGTGALEWMKHYTSADTVEVVAAGAGPAGEIWIAVSYGGSVDFPTDSDPITAPSFGANDIAVAKLTGDGFTAWVAPVGGGEDDIPSGIAVDAGGNSAVVGRFAGTAVDFDPDPAATEASNSAGGDDGFLLYLDPTGAYVWHQRFGDTGDDEARAVGMRRDTGEVWFGGATGQGAVLECWPADGTAAHWAKVFANDTGSNAVSSLVVDAHGTVYAAGAFDGTVDFDPNGTGAELSGNNSLFVVAFSSAGASQLAVSIDGATALDLAVRDGTSDSVVLAGSFVGTVDFDPGDGTRNVTAAGPGESAFTLSLSNAGAFEWVGWNDADTSPTLGTAIEATADRIFTAGHAVAGGTVDIDPAATIVRFVVPGGEVGVFFGKLDEDGTVVP